MATPPLYTPSLDNPSLEEVFADVFEQYQDGMAERETNVSLLNEVSMLLAKLLNTNSTIERGNAMLEQAIKSVSRGEEPHLHSDEPPSQQHDYTVGDFATRLLEAMPADQPNPLEVPWPLVEKWMKLHNSNVRPWSDDSSNGMNGMHQSSGHARASKPGLSNDLVYLPDVGYLSTLGLDAFSKFVRNLVLSTHEHNHFWELLATLGSPLTDDKIKALHEYVESWVPSATSSTMNSSRQHWDAPDNFFADQAFQAAAIQRHLSEVSTSTVMSSAGFRRYADSFPADSQGVASGSSASGAHAVASSSHMYVPPARSARPAEKPVIPTSRNAGQPAKLLHHQLLGVPPSLASAARSSEGAANANGVSLPANQMQSSQHPGAASIAGRSKARSKVGSDMRTSGSDMRSPLPKAMAASPAMTSWQEPLPPGLVANGITPGLVLPQAAQSPKAPQSPTSRAPKSKTEPKAKRGAVAASVATASGSLAGASAAAKGSGAAASIANATASVASPSAAAKGSGAAASAASIAAGATDPSADGPAGRAARRDEPLAPGVTTLIVRNVPARCSQQDLLEQWPPAGSYNFLHLPYSHSRRCTVGCVFINFVSHEAAVAFRERWDGEYLIPEANAKRLDFSVATIQGLDHNLWHLKKTKKTSRIKNRRYLPVLMTDNGTVRNFRQVLSETVVPADFVSHSPVADDIPDSDNEFQNPELLSSSSSDVDARTGGSRMQ